MTCWRAYAGAPASIRRRFFAGIARDEIKAKLRENTDELIARGGFGSPTIFVDGDDMYFGNDRAPLIRAALERAREPARDRLAPRGESAQT